LPSLTRKKSRIAASDPAFSMASFERGAFPNHRGAIDPPAPSLRKIRSSKKEVPVKQWILIHGHQD
jgi:hypothetical protein